MLVKLFEVKVATVIGASHPGGSFVECFENPLEKAIAAYPALTGRLVNLKLIWSAFASACETRVLHWADNINQEISSR